MDYSNMQQVNQLVGERRQIESALQQFESGGRIVSLSVGPPPPEGQEQQFRSMGIQVQTSYMDYPQQMVDQIKQSLQKRHDAIDSELQKLGVTGIQQR